MTFANNRVFIGNLEGQIQKEDIEAEFGKYGKLDNVWIAQNPPGFAFIVYESEQDAASCVENMNGADFMGSKIRCEHSKPKRRNGPRRDYGGGMGRGGRGGYGGGSYEGGNGGGGRYSGGGGGGSPYNGGGGGQRYGDRQDQRDRGDGGYGRSYQSNGGGNYRSDGRRGGDREYRGSDRQSSPPQYN